MPRWKGIRTAPQLLVLMPPIADTNLQYPWTGSGGAQSELRVNTPSRATILGFAGRCSGPQRLSIRSLRTLPPIPLCESSPNIEVNVIFVLESLVPNNQSNYSSAWPWSVSPMRYGCRQGPTVTRDALRQKKCSTNIGRSRPLFSHAQGCGLALEINAISGNAIPSASVAPQDYRASSFLFSINNRFPIVLLA
ncbi:hypothetical protein SAMN05421693_11824 [Ectothiorhodospira magna]|uniref:Uncharacterized protein n=1 Tax=Ectothiorhodospira magna TaxID=867345 RepID=A0A1H9DL86_9GAMM|nr:hypothetical protein SAMN05421693_11824 [Ectothiorhodospira magna]